MNQQNTQTTAKTTTDIILNVISWIMTVVAVIAMVFTIFSVTTFDRYDRTIFGKRLFIVRTNSMSATDFSAGDLIVVDEVDPSTLNVGDIIAFRSEDPNSMGEIFTHKIKELTRTNTGENAFRTYGTSNNTDDAYPVTYDHILGKYTRKFAGVGAFFSFLKSVPGYIICIFLPFAVLIGLQGMNCYKLFMSYKSEQLAEVEAKRRQDMAELAAEKEKLEAERIKAEQRMAELAEMEQRVAILSEQSEREASAESQTE